MGRSIFLFINSLGGAKEMKLNVGLALNVALDMEIGRREMVALNKLMTENGQQLSNLLGNQIAEQIQQQVQQQLSQQTQQSNVSEGVILRDVTPKNQRRNRRNKKNNKPKEVNKQ